MRTKFAAWDEMDQILILTYENPHSSDKAAMKLDFFYIFSIQSFVMTDWNVPLYPNLGYLIFT